MTASAEFYKDAAGGFRFRVKAGNGEVIANSEAYTSMAGAERGLDSLTTNLAAIAALEGKPADPEAMIREVVADATAGIPEVP